MKVSRKVVSMPAWYEKFRIPAELIEEAEVRHVTDRQARAVCYLNAPSDQKLDCELFPYFDRNGVFSGYSRGRLDTPYVDERGKSHRYHGVSKTRALRILYYPPGATEKLKSEATTAVLVEAEKSVLAIEAWARRTERTDILPLGMGGCQGWQQKDVKGHPGVLPDLSVCYERRVIVMVDSNWATNSDVRNARDKLVTTLTGRKCEVLVADLPQEKGVNGPDDYLAAHSDEEFAVLLDSAKEGVVAPYSEQALAQRFACENEGTVLYVRNVGYHVWDEHYWKPDEGAVDKLSHELCRTAAGECGKPSLADRIRSRRMRESILREAQPYLAKEPDEMDADPSLLGTPGGVVDLRTGELRPGTKSDLITMRTSVAPDFESEPKRWLRFLDEVMKDDADLIAYVNLLLGYCLTGEIREHKLFYLDGRGRNGKTVLVETMQKALGDYGATATMSLFLEKKFEGHSTSERALRGKRMVLASEPSPNVYWDVGRLKDYSGGTTLTARFMRQDDVSFRPVMKLLLSGNSRPRFRTVDDAIRDRFVVIPFRQHFAREDDTERLRRGSKRRDTKLERTLETELGSILAWAIKGAQRWYADRLREPSVVVEATSDYMTSQDSVKLWADERMVPRTNKSDVPATAEKAHKDYTAWCAAHREVVVPRGEFLLRLEGFGFRITRPGNVVTFRDWRLKGHRADGT